MEESWEEKTERLEREYQARIDRLREELREARDISGVVATNVREIGEGAMAQLKSDNAALAKRVAELDAMNATLAAKLSGLELRLTRRVSELKSQLAWTPVSAGLPTEPGFYVFDNGRGDPDPFWLCDDGSWSQRDDEYIDPAYLEEACPRYRRVELPKDGES